VRCQEEFMADRCKIEEAIDDNLFAISGKVPTDGSYDTKENG